MQFYKNIIRSYVDLPDHLSMIIHSLAGCNLHCYKCFNYNDLIKNRPKDYYQKDDILKIIKRDGFLFDAVIFSGGEFLLDNIYNIEDLLKEIRKIFNGLIIINTNGTSPRGIQYLSEDKLVDGFHIDMKLPYHLMNVDVDAKIFKKVLGIIPSQEMISNILLSLNMVVYYNNPYSQIRTVKYPILDNSFFEQIKEYVNSLNNHYGSNVKYYLNDFQDIKEE